MTIFMPKNGPPIRERLRLSSRTVHCDHRTETDSQITCTTGEPKRSNSEVGLIWKDLDEYGAIEFNLILLIERLLSFL